MSGLIEVVDVNLVTWLYPPTSVVAAVLNDGHEYGQRWKATVTLINGARLVLVDDNDAQLVRRLKGEAHP